MGKGQDLMAESIKVSAVIPASAGRIFQAWLDGSEHMAMTGGEAMVAAEVGGSFSAWDGYITGVTTELEPQRRIVQTWRTSEFLPEHSDSRLEVVLAPAQGGTRVTLLHTDIPDGQGKSYKQGWIDYYLTPMKAYFRGLAAGK